MSSNEKDRRTLLEFETRCTKLLRNFRVAELQALLRQHGKSIVGRKSDLYQRSVDMLHTVQDPKLVEERIRCLHAQMQGTRRVVGSNLVYMHRPEPNGDSLVAAKEELKKRSLKMNNARELWKHHTTYHHATRTTQPAVVHPDVRFKDLPFYSMVDSIIKPTSLVSQKSYSRSGSSHTQDASFFFHLSPQQIQRIVASRTSQQTYGVQVQLRMCRQETSCPQDDMFPKMCYLRVNSEYTPIPGYYPQLSQKAGYKPTGRPIDITHLLKLSPSAVNKFTILWHYDVQVPQGHVICLNLVKSHSSSDLLGTLQMKGSQSSELSRALLKQKMSADVDAEISTTSLRVSLMCPLGKMRMKIPCRAASCSHLQCFDASLYLQMNERKTTWICPVCDKPAPFSSLIIDGMFQEILESSSYTDIEFYQDGSWKPIMDAAADSSSASTQCVPSMTVELHRDGQTEIMPVKPREEVNVIDLTVDSDSDTEESSSNNLLAEQEISSGSTTSISSLEVPSYPESSQPQLLFVPGQPESSPLTHFPLLNMPLTSMASQQIPVIITSQPAPLDSLFQQFTAQNRNSPVIFDPTQLMLQLPDSS